jgi:uroporphyrin-III C-methyltransferase
VRLKGGDPMLFGRAQEEIDALRAAGIEFEVVPGITAALAAAADLGVSLTRRGVSRNVVFATPRVGDGEAASDWAEPLATADTGVIYMGAGEPGIAAMLSRAASRQPSGGGCRKCAASARAGRRLGGCPLAEEASPVPVAFRGRGPRRRDRGPEVLNPEATVPRCDRRRSPRWPRLAPAPASSWYRRSPPPARPRLR